MRLFKSKAFGRLALSQDITDEDLCETIGELGYRFAEVWISGT